MGTNIYMRKIPKLERKNYHRIILKNNPVVQSQEVPVRVREWRGAEA